MLRDDLDISMKTSIAAVLMVSALLYLGCASTAPTDAYVGKFASNWDEAVAKLNPVPAPLDLEPMPLSRPQPVYPMDMRRQDRTGTVTVEFIVGRHGRVMAARALEADRPQFAEAAVAAVKRWRFEPGIKDDVAVNTKMRTILTFGLSPQEAPQ